MGFFSTFFPGNKNNHAKAKEARQAPDIDWYRQVADTVVFSEKTRSDLKTKLTGAFADPASFYDEQGEFTLSDRGLTFPKSAALTPKFVFIDTLIEAGEMAEVDWKEAEDEIRSCVRKIMETKQMTYSISAAERYENEHTHEVIQLINDVELVPNGYALQILDINSDCYVFTVIPLELAGTAKEMFSHM